MPRPLPLILTLLLCSACTLQNGTLYAVAPTAAASPTAKTAQEGPGAFERIAGQETQNDAFLMGENQAAAIVEPTLDANATVTASLAALKIAQDEQVRLQGQLADLKAEAADTRLKIAEAEREKAKYEAANRKTEQDQDADRIAAKNADARLLEAANEAKRLDAELAQAQAAIADARTRGLVALFVIVAACVAGIWFTPRMRQPRQGAAVEAEPQERSPFVERTAPAMGTSVRRETPPGWDATETGTFARNVRTSTNVKGIPFTRGWWVEKNGMSDRKWDAVNRHCDLNGYTLAPLDAANSIKTWTPAGEGWLALFENEPPPHDGEHLIFT